MILSMTGYGKAVAEFTDKNVIVEIKSLNSKTVDISSRLNHAYRDKDIEIRTLLAEQLIRGKIDISIFFDYKEYGNARVINTEVVQAYITQLKEIDEKSQLNSSNILEIAMKLPEAMHTEQITEVSDEEWEAVRSATLTACEHIRMFRQQEGQALERDIRNNISAIQQGLQSIVSFEASRVLRIRE